LDKTLAGPGRRFFAIFLDGLICGLFSGIHWTVAVLSLVYWLTKDAWPVLKGQSVGKKAMGIRVVHQETGEPITREFGVAAVRQTSLLIPLFNLVDSFMVIFGPRRQRFGDRWAKTLVVLEGK
jgi:uncharacterized RDD family membrane protein YckC